jgi:2-methylaconitate cis-trans-isomerase PrpF
LQDDGIGNILAVTSAVSTRRIFQRKIGTVDYATGQVKLSKFKVDSYSGNNAIKIYANTANKDIKSPKDRILIIRPQDVTINVRSI